MENNNYEKKIETIDGNVEDIKYEVEVVVEEKRKRNFLKPLIIGAIAVVITGGVGAYAYDKYETTQRAKIQEAYSNVKMNVATQTSTQNSGDSSSNTNITQQNPQNAKSQEEIRKIVSEAISTSEQSISFTKIKPEYEDDYAYQNNGVPLYIYDVEARANGLEYDVKIDAVSGKILKVEIDN